MYQRALTTVTFAIITLCVVISLGFQCLISTYPQAHTSTHTILYNFSSRLYNNSLLDDLVFVNLYIELYTLIKNLYTCRICNVHLLPLVKLHVNL